MVTSDFRFSPHLIDPGAPQQPLPKTKVFDFFPGSVDMGRVGVRVRVIGLGLELVSRAVFWAFFEISLITLEPHVGHKSFPDFYTLSNDSGSSVR